MAIPASPACSAPAVIGGEQRGLDADRHSIGLEQLRLGRQRLVLSLGRVASCPFMTLFRALTKRPATSRG